MRSIISPMKPPTPADIRVLALTIEGEAESESSVGQLAVGWSVRNRAERQRCGLAEAALKSSHYSCFNNAAWNDKNQLRMMTRELSDKPFALCMIAALQVAHGLEPDPTGGARHYHTLDLPVPGWAKDKNGKRLPYASIGRHAFYRNID